MKGSPFVANATSRIHAHMRLNRACIAFSASPSETVLSGSCASPSRVRLATPVFRGVSQAALSDREACTLLAFSNAFGAAGLALHPKVLMHGGFCVSACLVLQPSTLVLMTDFLTAVGLAKLVEGLGGASSPLFCLPSTILLLRPVCSAPAVGQ